MFVSDSFASIIPALPAAFGLIQFESEWRFVLNWFVFLRVCIGVIIFCSTAAFIVFVCDEHSFPYFAGGLCICSVTDIVSVEIFGEM